MKSMVPVDMWFSFKCSCGFGKIRFFNGREESKEYLPGNFVPARTVESQKRSSRKIKVLADYLRFNIVEGCPSCADSAYDVLKKVGELNEKEQKQ